MDFLENAIFHVSKELLIAVAIFWAIKFYVDRWRIFYYGNKIPGPKGWPIIGNALDFLEKDLDFFKKLHIQNQKFGTCRIWLGSYLHVIICTPEDAEIYCRFDDRLEKSDHYDYFKPILGEGLFTANGATWKKGKRLIEPSFTYKSIQKYFPVIQRNSDKLIKILREKSQKPGYPYYRCMINCTFDNVIEATMNYEIDAQNGNAKVLECVEELMAQMWHRIGSPWQRIELLYRLTAMGKKFYSNIKSIKNFANDQINVVKKGYFLEKERYTKGEEGGKAPKQKFFVQNLLDDDVWSPLELQDHVITMVATGFETTTSAATFAAMMLGIHKDVQERLYEELSTSLTKNFEVEDVLELDYLDRVIKESLRIFPVAPMTIRHVKEDIQLTDYVVPEGAAIVINILYIHRDPKHWDNPNKFDPDHFLPENVEKRHKYAYIPFLSGRRKCIAGKYALTSLKLMLSKIVLNFKIDCDLTMNQIENDIRTHLTLKMKDSYYPIRLTPRN